MRRLIQTPAQRPNRRKTSGIQKNPHPRTSTRNGSRRLSLSSGGSAARSQLDGDTAQARFSSPPTLASSRGFEVEGVSVRKLSKAIYASHTNYDFFGVSHAGQDVVTVSILNGIHGAFPTQPTLPPSSRGFEVLGISARHLSSEAIQALSSCCGNNPFFGGSAADNSEDVMLNPFLDSVPECRNKNQGLPADAFLDLFKAISALNRQPSNSAADLSVLEDENNVGEIESCVIKGETIDTPGSGLTADEEVQKATLKKARPKKYANEVGREKHAISCRLSIALKEDPYKPRNSDKVMDLFNEGRYSPHELLTNRQINSIYRYIVKSDLVAGYDVLKYSVARCKEQDRLVPLNVYYPLFKEFSGAPLQLTAASRRNPFKPRPLTVDEVQHLLEDITQHIREEYSEGKKMVYQYLLLPELVLDLYCHWNPIVNSCAKPIIEHILRSNIPLLNPELFERILEGATPDKSGPDSLPHHRILSQLVLNGNRPKPETVVNVLHCYHPFTNTEATHEVLSIIQKLHPDNDFSPSEAEDYRVGLGVLESISKASARINIDLNLLVWDVVELFGYNPTESMFEDVIMSFAATKQDGNMYTALIDMEINGFKPSRALLRYVALKVGFDQKRLDHAQKMLACHENEHVRSTHTMNTVMMAYGMKRDLNSAFVVYEDLPRFNLQPDANTFCFLMEILYVDTKKRFPYQTENPPTFNPQDIEDVVGAAQIILDAMEEAGIGKTSHFYHEHIRLLCALGLLDDANEVLEEALHSGMTVPVQSLFLLATRFTVRGKSEKAFAVAERSVAAGCGELPQLYNRIRNIMSGERHSPKKPALR